VAASINFGGIFDVERKRQKLKELEVRAQDPALWQNTEAMGNLQKERSTLERELGPFGELEKLLSDTAELLELGDEDEEIGKELEQGLTTAAERIDKLELQRMLSGPYDNSDAIVSINAGAGGTESQDWASMLARMLTRYCENRGFGLEIIDTQYGDEAGIKSMVFIAKGPFAFGYLRAENGVHRLVRISPFDANKRRHTSFASVSVVPEIDDDIEIEIRDEDLRVDTYRASGAGGQHVNKTDSAVRITHHPTGIVVACQAERSQHKNRAKALKLLRARLFEIEMNKKEEERTKLGGIKKKIEWGSQIRSYVLQPYRMVKDHRTGFEMGNADAVLDGQLDGFIEAYLMATGSTASEA
jgi:peptide chain release factor 2